MKKKFKALIIWAILIILIFASCSNKSEDTEEYNNYFRIYNHSPSAYDFGMDYLIGRSDKIVYAQVVSRDENTAETFGYYNKGVKSYCVSDVKIKVLETFKGETEKELIYRETGGKTKNEIYVSNRTGSLSVGDKAVLFLSENNMLVGVETKGRFKETAEGFFYADKGILKEGMYKENTLPSAKISKDELFSYIKECVQKYNGEKIEGRINPEGIENLEVFNDYEYCYDYFSDVVYGEVVSIGDEKVYDILSWSREGGEVFTYKFREVKIKVLENLKGESKEVTYYMPVSTENIDSEHIKKCVNLKVNDKVFINLNSDGVILNANNLLVEDENGKIKIDGKEFTVKDYINEVKSQFKAIEDEKRAWEEERKSYPGGGKWERFTTVDYVAGYEINLKDILTSTDMIVYGKAEIVRNDVLYFSSKFDILGDDCYTEVKLKDAKCVYSRYGDKNLNEYSYLYQGGETEECIYRPYGIVTEDGADVFVFLQFDGENYIIEYQMPIYNDDILRVPTMLIPEGYEEAYKKEKTAANYGEILAEYIENVE